MRKMCIVLLATALVHSAFAQAPKIELEQYGLKGRVRTVIVQGSKISEDGHVKGTPHLISDEYYDEQGRLTQRVIFDDESNPIRTDMYKIIDGVRLSKTIKGMPPPPPPGDAKPSDPQYDMKDIYKYEGNKIERTTYSKDGAQAGRNVSTYDEKGNFIRFEFYERDGQLEFSRASVFDAQGAETERTYYDGRGQIVEA